MIFTLKETNLAAQTILKALKPGDIVALCGPLAAGKTTLTAAILKEMGYVDRVTSPTFVLEKHYPVAYNDFTEVIHLDFYRLEPKDVKTFGWQDYLGTPGTLTIIEWPERVAHLLPDTAKKITLEIVDEKTRRLKTD